MQSHHHREVRERDSPKTRGKTTLVSSLPLPLSFHVCARAHMFSFLCVPPCASSLHTCRYCCCCCFRLFFLSSVFMLCFSFCGFSLTHSHILTHTRIFQKETSFLLRRCFFFVCVFFIIIIVISFLISFPFFFFPHPFFLLLLFCVAALKTMLANNH